MNPFEMVVLIIAIVTVGSIIKARSKAHAPTSPGSDASPRLTGDPDADRLRDEVRQLKERVAVLERLATDNNRALDLDREIEKLRLGDR